MKAITLKLTVTRKGDAVPPQAGDTVITPEEETIILDSVERLSPEPENEHGVETTEFVTAATIDCDADGRYTIRYTESELSGMEGTVTSITFLDGDRTILTILREGAVRSALVLQAGKFHTGLYETPVMPLEITTMTYSLQNTLTLGGGVVHADYSLRIGGVTTSRTKMTLELFPH